MPQANIKDPMLEEFKMTAEQKYNFLAHLIQTELEKMESFCLDNDEERKQIATNLSEMVLDNVDKILAMEIPC